jgi:hypothetical protein
MWAVPRDADLIMFMSCVVMLWCWLQRAEKREEMLGLADLLWFRVARTKIVAAEIHHVLSTSWDY